MSGYTSSQLAEMIEKKLSHNFGVTPVQASDELFYKACALVVRDIMSERRTKFKEETKKQQNKTSRGGRYGMKIPE